MARKAVQKMHNLNKKRLLPALVLLLLAAAAALFLLQGRESFVGERRAEPDAYLLDIQQMTGTDGHTLALQTGETLHVRFTCTSGSLRLDITAPDGTAVYSGNGQTATRFTVTAADSGVYTVAVTARRAAGVIQIQTKEILE